MAILSVALALMAAALLFVAVRYERLATSPVGSPPGDQAPITAESPGSSR